LQRKAVSGIMLALLLIGMLTLAFNIQPAKATATIYIRADGSVDPPTAPIQRDGDVYSFTDNFFGSVVIERNDIVVDGAGYTLQGTGIDVGVNLTERSGVVISNLLIREYHMGIHLASCSHISIRQNSITSNEYGVYVNQSAEVTISANSITANSQSGVFLEESNLTAISGNSISSVSEPSPPQSPYWGIQLNMSNNNIISGNDMTGYRVSLLYLSNCNIVSGNNLREVGAGIVTFTSCFNVISENNVSPIYFGISFWGLSTNNTISRNNITSSVAGNYPPGEAMGIHLLGWSDDNVIYENIIAENRYGIYLMPDASDNRIYHNDFLDNHVQAFVQLTEYNIWDDGYPSGGNYWSDYDGADEYSGQAQDQPGSDGIGDAPYPILYNNQDNYPLMEPWGWTPIPPQPDFEISVSPPSQSVGREDSVEYTITVTSINDFESEVSLYVLACYADLDVDFYPSEVAPPPSGTIESTLTITTTSSTPLQTFEIEIWATSGGIPKRHLIKLSVEVSLEVPFQEQVEGSNWCIPTSLAMVLQYYGEIFHGWDYAEATKLSFGVGVTLEDLYDYVQAHYPLLTPRKGVYESKEAAKNDIESYISNDFPVILGLGSPPTGGSEGGHAIVVVGFNETGLFVNDPSGALADKYHIVRTSKFNHCFVEWEAISQFIQISTPIGQVTSLIAVEGLPKPPAGSIYFMYTNDVKFHDLDDPNWQESYTLYPNQGLIWNHTKSETDPGEIGNIIKPKCKGLYPSIAVSNCKSSGQSFTIYCEILNYVTDEIVYVAPEIDVDLESFSRRLEFWEGIDASQRLTEGVPYQLGFYLYDSEGSPVDYFRSPLFYWIQGVRNKLEEEQEHLYLHVYDEQGNHVGLNHSTNEIDLNIPGSYYHDNLNGTIIIVVPQIINLTIVVDAEYAEDPVESFNLTVTANTDDGVYSQTHSGNIIAGGNQTFKIQASEIDLTLQMQVDVDIDPDTLNLKSQGQWITAYIQLPEGYNPEDIDATTILLNRTVPPILDPKYDFVTNASEYLVDHNNDGILERMVKFDTAEVTSLIRDHLAENGWKFCNATITITGELLGGIQFEGSDIIKVIVGDVNGDNVVGIFDLARVGIAYFTFEGEPEYDFNADMNEDGIIDMRDLHIVAVNYGKS